MTIFIAGLQSIPGYYYEAGEIDGANFFQRLFHITLPMLMPAIMINVVFGLTYGLKVFDVIYALTNGGPGRMTEVVATAILHRKSVQREPGGGLPRCPRCSSCFSPLSASL
jgi:raffinose/stachyose/melibiose transport system permease protein